MLFDNAHGDYAAGNYSLAISGFERYLSDFPKSANAPTAQLYIAQAHEAAGNYKDAIAAYDRVIAGYGSSSQVPIAHFKRAGVLERIGDVAAARLSYESLQKLFPASDAATLARQALQRLKNRR